MGRRLILMDKGLIDVTPPKELQMKNPLMHIKQKPGGRVFAIGDLHAAYACLERLKKGIDFDEDKDIMVSVADLVDRGPDPMECLRLIKKPWFKCVLSNHEQMMFEAFHGGPSGSYWFMNGGSWGKEAWLAWKAKQRGEEAVITDEFAELYDLVEDVGELPFLITVTLENGKKFHIIHAELPPRLAGGVTDEMLEDPETVRKLAKTQAGDGDAFTWGRSLFYSYYGISLNTVKMGKYIVDRDVASFNPDRSHVISGHTIMTQPLTILGQTNIDTCAYGSTDHRAQGWEALTCIDLESWKFYQATPTDFREVEPLTITQEDIDNKL